MTAIPGEFSRFNSKVCSVEGKIYLVGGGSAGERRKVTEYNPCTDTWRNMPSLQLERDGQVGVCTLDHKIFVVGADNTCEMLDMGEKDPEWKYIANMKGQHHDASIAILDRKIYVLGGAGTDVEVYDVDEGIFM